MIREGEGGLGFEWILMEMLPGASLRTRWKGLSGDAKRGLVRKVAGFQAELFVIGFVGLRIYSSIREHSLWQGIRRIVR